MRRPPTTAEVSSRRRVDNVTGFLGEQPIRDASHDYVGAHQRVYEAVAQTSRFSLANNDPTSALLAEFFQVAREIRDVQIWPFRHSSQGTAHGGGGEKALIVGYCESTGEQHFLVKVIGLMAPGGVAVRGFDRLLPLFQRFANSRLHG